jgi:hypothetical protein
MNALFGALSKFILPFFLTNHAHCENAGNVGHCGCKFKRVSKRVKRQGGGGFMFCLHKGSYRQTLRFSQRAVNCCEYALGVKTKDDFLKKLNKFISFWRYKRTMSTQITMNTKYIEYLYFFITT